MKKTDYKKPEDLIGKEVEIINNTGGHGLPLGTIIKITNIGVGNRDYFYDGTGRYTLRCENFKLVPQTLAALDKSIENLKEKKLLIDKDISVLALKKAFMIKNKLKTFDENTFKVFSVLNTLKSKKSDIEMAITIAELIN